MSGLCWGTDKESECCNRNTKQGWVEGMGINKRIRGCMDRWVMWEELITIA